jgi:hypothetical protein
MCRCRVSVHFSRVNSCSGVSGSHPSVPSCKTLPKCLPKWLLLHVPSRCLVRWVHAQGAYIFLVNHYASTRSIPGNVLLHWLGLSSIYFSIFLLLFVPWVFGWLVVLAVLGFELRAYTLSYSIRPFV